MSDNDFSKCLFRLGDFIVDPIMFVISRGSDASQVQPKVMEVLVCLVKNHGQVVSKEYLLEHVWPGVFVVEGALRRCIFLLRKHLETDSGVGKYLETIPRRGYRLTQVPEPMEPVSQEVQKRASPATEITAAYRGLRVFDSAHAQIFFGREKAVAQVTQALDEQVEAGRAFVLVLGSSGCGKSSLVRAGVLPMLVNRAKTKSVNLHSMLFQISESAASPLQYLAQKLIESSLQADTEGTDEASLRKAFEEDYAAGIACVLNHLGNNGHPKLQLLIVFDQFEELFSQNSMNDTEREQMVSVLYSLARSGLVWIVATMRSEFYPQFMMHENLRFLKGRHGQVDLPFPGAAEIADIVRRPAQIAGFTFDADKFNHRLDQTLIEDATRQPNSLPLLQFALRELEMTAGVKKVMKQAHYKKLGNLDGCLSMHAERTFDGLPKNVQNVLPEVLEHLVIADPRNAGRVLKRTVSLSAFEHSPECRTLIDAFINARLITSFLDKSTQAPSVQIAHEAVLLHWQRAREWAHENYAEMKFRQWLAELSLTWHADGKASHYLLRDGKPLLEAKRLAQKPNYLSANDVDFVQASTKRVQQSGWLKRAVSASLLILSIGALILWQNALSSGEKTRKASLRAEAITDFMVANYASADPGNTGGRTLSAKEMLQRAYADVTQMEKDGPEIRAAILRVIGESYVKMGEYDDAEKVLSLAEKILPQIEADDPRLATQVLLELGGIRRESQQYTEAANYFERAHVLAASTDDKLLMTNVYNMKGILEHNQGHHQKALKYYALAIENLDQVTDDTRNLIKLRVSIYNNQGMSYFLSKNNDESSATFEQAIALVTAHGLEETPEYSMILGNLGTLRRVQNRNEEAIDLYDAAIKLRTRLHGPNHRKVVTFLVNKVSAELKISRYDDAVKTARAGLDITATGDHFDPIAMPLLSTKYLSALWKSNQTISADDIAAAQSAIPKLIEAYGNEHPVVVESKDAIAASLKIIANSQPVPE